MISISPTDYDALTRLVIAREVERNACCVDVGCHSGDILDMMLEYAPEGSFYCFEPIPDLAKGLRAKYREDRVRIFDIALSDQAGSSSFNYVVTNPGYSGLRRRSYDNPHEQDRSITVRTETMDHILGDNRVDFIKIDVEGAELQVLRGGKAIIRRDKPTIVFEHGLGAADCYGTTAEQIFSLLHGDCGLHIYCLHEFLDDLGELTESQFCEHFYSGAHYYFLAHRS